MIQVYITNAYRAYEIADHYRAHGAFVCLGGLHVTSLPEEAARTRTSFSWVRASRRFRSFCTTFALETAEKVYTSPQAARWSGFHPFGAT